jgi:hypothetical protein
MALPELMLKHARTMLQNGLSEEELQQIRH